MRWIIPILLLQLIGCAESDTQIHSARYAIGTMKPDWNNQTFSVDMHGQMFPSYYYGKAVKITVELMKKEDIKAYYG